MRTLPLKLIISGGKTGGHLFPGIAVAQAVQKIHPGARILFVGTDAPFEVRTVQAYGYDHKTVFSKPIKGRNLLNKAISLSAVLVSLIQSLWILQGFKPDFVLGVGGFSSFAVVLAARILGIPTAIQEQNAFPGLTNRWLARFADTIFTAFEATRGWEHHPRVRFVGNPVRITDAAQDDQPDKKPFRSEKIRILVTGGSQGATSINRAFVEALTLLKNPGDFEIIHQTGIQDEAEIRQKYLDLGIDATVQAFFQDMPHIQATAHIAITRSGAGIVSELCAHGLPAILIPFPHAADDHQTHNARALADAGGAVMIQDSELSGRILKQTLENLLSDQTRLVQMSGILRAMARPDAARAIAEHVSTQTEPKD